MAKIGSPCPDCDQLSPCLNFNPNDAGKGEFSPVVLAVFVAFGVTTGAILLNSGVLLSEQALGGSPQSQVGGNSLIPSSLDNALTNSLVIDQKTRLLLNAALVFLGLGATLIGESPYINLIFLALAAPGMTECNDTCKLMTFKDKPKHIGCCVCRTGSR